MVYATAYKYTQALYTVFWDISMQSTRNRTSRRILSYAAAAGIRRKKRVGRTERMIEWLWNRSSSESDDEDEDVGYSIELGARQQAGLTSSVYFAVLPLQQLMSGISAATERCARVSESSSEPGAHTTREIAEQK